MTKNNNVLSCTCRIGIGYFFVFTFVVGLSVDEIELLSTLASIVMEVNNQMNKKCLSVGSGLFGVTRMT